MRVLLHPADQHGCGHYRIHEPARIAAAEGVEVEISESIPRLQAVDGPNAGAIYPAPTDADVVVFQRPAKGALAELIPHYQARGHVVVVDVDDDFSCLSPQHPFYEDFQPRNNPDINHRHLQRICALADLVTVTTPALAERYGAHGRVAILPNCVPEALLSMPRSSDGHTLGWSGAVEMHPGDLEVTHAGVADALARTGWRFRVIGDPEGVGEKLGIEKPDGSGWVEIDEWYAELGSLDVGIVPLGATRFNEAKSYLKGLEYAARGVPFVASPMPEYEALAAEGVGTTAADRGRNWRQELVALMEDDALRSEMAERGKAVVAERHTYETEGWRWLQAWQDACDASPTRTRALARSA